MRFLCSILLGALFLLPTVTLAYTNPGMPHGYVNDFAGVLQKTDRDALEAKLTTFEKDTHHEIAVAIIESLDGDTIENFAEKLFAEWGVGKKNADNGILVLIAIKDRAMRIEVGYGFEGALTDAQSSWIINNTMKPAFQKNDFYGGIDGAVDKIIAATQGEVIPSEQSKGLTNINYNFTFLQIIFVCATIAFSWFGSILGRSKSWWAGGVVGALIGSIWGFIFGFIYIGLITMTLTTILGLAFDAAVSKNYSERKALGFHPSWWAGGRGFGGRPGGGFGGFGGGRSGGGGASGSW